MTSDEEILEGCCADCDGNPFCKDCKWTLEKMKLAREDVLKSQTHTYKDTMIAQREAGLAEKNKEIQKLKEDLIAKDRGSGYVCTEQGCSEDAKYCQKHLDEFRKYYNVLNDEDKKQIKKLRDALEKIAYVRVSQTKWQETAKKALEGKE